MNASRKVILIPDTSWLMEIGKQNRNYLLEFVKQEPENRIIKIHNRVFKELDALKNVDEKSHQARKVSQYIEEVVKKYPKNIEIDNFGINRPSDNFKNALTSDVDAIVLTLAQNLKNEGDVVLATTDRNQRILAEKDNIRTMKDEPINNLIINKNEKTSFDSDEVVYSSSPIMKRILNGFLIVIAIGFLGKLFSGDVGLGIFLGIISIPFVFMIQKCSYSSKESGHHTNYKPDAFQNEEDYNYVSGDYIYDSEQSSFRYRTNPAKDVIYNPIYSSLSCNIYHDDEDD